MHREFDPTHSPFRPRSHAPLYLFAGLLAGLLVADLWPPLSARLHSFGVDLPTWQSRELFGVRFALIAAVVGGARSLHSSFERLAEGIVGADLAIVIACAAAILIGEPLIAAEVVFIGLFGECLEAVTFDRTRRSLRGLAELFPTRCWVLRDGQEVRVRTAELILGDHVVVKPGGKIPVDGVVIAGRSSVDAAALTGESLPQDKGPGDPVFAGCVNQFGALTIEAERLADETVAGQVVALTASALRDKCGGERLADRLARYFLPVVSAVAVVTFGFNLWWQSGPTGLGTAARIAVYPTLAVLVTACPCPLVLATPAAVVAALGRLAGTGVLVKGGSALERLASVTAFAFDKTGTLTEGRPEVGDVLPLGSISADELLAAAATAEQRSEHPLAKAILTAARGRELALDDIAEFQAHPGIGVSVTTTTGTRIVVGTRRLLEDRGLVVPTGVAGLLDRLDATGQTALHVAKGDTVLGVIGERDRLRPEAAGVLAELTALGISPIILLTGDREPAARSVCERLPLTEFHSDMLPTDKAALVAGGDARAADASQPPPRTAFVGDGINDAPALAVATVGIAIGSGTEAAAAAGDIVMMGDPLHPLPLLVRLSRETVRVIRQNIVWFGFGVNLVGVVLTGWLWPVFSATPEWYETAPLVGVLYHQLGSLAVLLNSMRLLTFERTASNPVLAHWTARYRAFDRWANTVHLDDLLHAVENRRKPIGIVFSAVAVVAWLLSGLTQIGATEVGIVQRFGAVRGSLHPGLHARWPWPVEAVTKLRPAEVRTVEIGFRRLSEDKAAALRQAAATQDRLRRASGSSNSVDGRMTWANAHSDAAIDLREESLLVTGDGNLVELLATVRYTVVDPVEFAFGTVNPDGLIRSAAEGVFRELAAGQPFHDLLTSNRSGFEARATDRLARRLREVAPAGLGVGLTGLTVHDLHPPREVVDSYHAVAEAIQRRDRTTNDAQAQAIRIKRKAEETAMRIVREADASAAAKLVHAAAERDTFFARVAARATLPSGEEVRLSSEHESLVRAGLSPEAAAREIDTRRQRLIVNRRFLTDFGLSLDATVSALRGRNKVIVDSDHLPGRRHLLIVDPAGRGSLPATLPLNGLPTAPGDP